MQKNIYLYCDDGAGLFSVKAAQDHFKKENIKLVTADHIIKNGIPNHVDLFIMPGGADCPYAEKLNGRGNDVIRHYVEQGGTYLGICAGAYYGCRSFEFQKGTNEEICDDRELGFFKGKAIGCLPSLTSKPYDNTVSSATSTPIRFNNSLYQSFYWGGCRFEINESDKDNKTCVLARYEAISGEPPAIIDCAVGMGHAILSGVHFEVSLEFLSAYDFDYPDDKIRKEEIIKNLDGNNQLYFNDLITLNKEQVAC